MKRLLTSLFVVHALACSLMAQTKTVLKTPATNALTESLVVPSGKTLTIASGATINATGATVTGFTASAAWADITGKPSTFPPEAHTQAISTITGLQDALDAKAAASALSSYLPLTGGTLTGSLTGTSFVSAGTIFPTRTITITGGQSLTWNDTNGTGFSVTVRPDSPSANQIVNFNPNGNIVTTADTGRVTSTMILDGTIAADDIADAAITNAKLAGSIALSKLAITGTPDGTKFIRDDGSYQAISLSGYLPLTGGTLTGTLVVTQGTANTGLLSSTGYSLTGGNATPAIDIAGTLNTSGNPAVMQVAMTTTAAGSTTALARFLGTTTGTANVFAVLAPVANAQASAAFQIGAGLFCGEYAASSEWWFGFSNNKFAGKFAIDTIGTKVANNGYYAFGGDSFANSSADLLLRRDATARLQLGTDSAAPISQQLKTADGVGTNIAASNLTLGGSLSTGTGAGGDVITVTSMSGSSGSSANATQERSRAIGRFVNLTEGTATAVASIALASGKVTGGTATITVWASDGTDHQALTSEIRFAAINKAGTLTTTCTQTDGTTAASAGTLTVTYDTAASGNNILLRASATSSLTQTTLRCRLVITALNGDDVQTVTPQ